MRSLGWALIHYVSVLIKRGNLDTDTHTQGESLQVKEAWNLLFYTVPRRIQHLECLLFKVTQIVVPVTTAPVNECT